LITRILSFNVGVEIGQVIALAFMLLIISGWRKTRSFKQFSTVANSGLIAAGIFLFMMQMHGFSHNANPDDFTFSANNYSREPKRMEQTLSNNKENLIQPLSSK